MPPDASFLATLLRRCAAATSRRETRQLHALLLTSDSNSSDSPFLYNNILSMYARCGSLVDSQILFDKMPHRNYVSYNVLISSYSRRPRHYHFAFRLFDQMGIEGLSPNGSTFTSLLHVAAELEDWILGCSIHARCVKMGLWNNVHVQTSLLRMYSNCGEMDCAKKVFCFMVDKDSMSWDGIISGCVKNREIERGLEFFCDMLRNGVSPTRYTYSIVLNACAKLGKYDCGRIVHCHVLASGVLIDLPLQNALLDMYCSCGDTCAAYNIFSCIENPDDYSWNTMIGGYSDNGEEKKAIDMFVTLLQVSPVKPDEYTFAAVISSMGGLPTRDYGKPIHAQTEKRGFSQSVYIGSTLISMYFSDGDAVSSQRIFSSFSNKDAVLWTDMIAGYARIGESESAMKLFPEMWKEGCLPDSFALSSAVNACTEPAMLRHGEMIHCLALKMGNDSKICVHGSLVDMYAKNGELKAAAYIFSCQHKHDLKSWNSILTGYGNHGKAVEAFQIFYAMIKRGLAPDHVTFISLLSACSNCGLVKEGRFFWNYMKENGLEPGPKHYSCTVSLLSRAGLWEEAEEMIAESPFVNLESLRAILSSSLKNGNLRRGIHAAEQILKITTEDSAANKLLTNLYAAAGRWEDVSDTRRRMRNLVSEKDPGLSWIEVQNNVHMFGSGDQTHQQNGEMRTVLSELVGNLTPAIVDDTNL